MKNIEIRTSRRVEFVDITAKVERLIRESQIENGMCVLFVPHTTAGITINEGADPSVRQDVIETLNKLVPFEGNYSHLEGNSPAHIKSTLVGCSQVVIVEKGKMLLGTWQSIYFCEFDGPRNRKVFVKIIPA